MFGLFDHVTPLIDTGSVLLYQSSPNIGRKGKSFTIIGKKAIDIEGVCC